MLVLASATTGSLHSSAALACPEQSQTAISNARTGSQIATAQQTPQGVRRAGPVISAALRGRGLPAPQVVAQSYVMLTDARTQAQSSATLFARAGALRHVQVLDSAGACE